jgi:hypothetical protein
MSLNDTNDRHRAGGRGYLWLHRPLATLPRAFSIRSRLASWPWKEKKRLNMIDVLRDQIIVCGCGRLGRTVADEREAVAT